MPDRFAVVALPNSQPKVTFCAGILKDPRRAGHHAFSRRIACAVLMALAGLIPSRIGLWASSDFGHFRRSLEGPARVSTVGLGWLLCPSVYYLAHSTALHFSLSRW